MTPTPEPESEVAEIARYAAFVTGQIDALHASHRADLEFPAVRKLLPPDEIRRGRRLGEEWLASLWARHEQDLPEYLARRGTVAKVARLLGDRT